MQTLMQRLLQKAVWVTTLSEEVLDHSSIKASLLQQSDTARSHAAARRYPVQNQCPDRSVCEHGINVIAQPLCFVPPQVAQIQCKQYSTNKFKYCCLLRNA